MGGTDERSEEGPPMVATAQPLPDNTEVRPRAQRRRFSPKEKLRIIREYEMLADGEKGAYLRREGLYASVIATWRKSYERNGELGLLPKKRGRKGRDPLEITIKKLTRQNERLSKKLEQAKLVIDVQKKLAEILGIELPKTDPIEDEELE